MTEQQRAAMPTEESLEREQIRSLLKKAEDEAQKTGDSLAYWAAGMGLGLLDAFEAEEQRAEQAEADLELAIEAKSVTEVAWLNDLSRREKAEAERNMLARYAMGTAYPPDCPFRVGMFDAGANFCPDIDPNAADDDECYKKGKAFVCWLAWARARTGEASEK